MADGGRHPGHLMRGPVCTKQMPPLGALSPRTCPVAGPPKERSVFRLRKVPSRALGAGNGRLLAGGPRRRLRSGLARVGQFGWGCDGVSLGDLDAELRRPRHTGAVQQGRRPQGRPELRQERPRPGTGDLGRQRLLRAAGEVDRLQDAGLAGVVGRAAREPARGPIGAEPLQGPKSHGDPALRLLPRLSQGPDRSRTTSRRSRTRPSSSPRTGG